MIPSQVARFEYTLSSTSQILPFPNKFFANSHVQVVRLDEVDGVAAVTPLVEASDYSVSGANNPDGGFVTMLPGGANDVQIGDDIVLRRNVPITQLLDLIQNADQYSPQSTEDALDKLTMICQMLLDVITNANYGVPPGFVLRRIGYCKLDGTEQISTFLVQDD